MNFYLFFAVVDPGFPRGGRSAKPKGVGVNILFGQFFRKNP